ncbi:MAG: hypothetical protein I8H77_11230 [Comamonadaceae bacterium]|nr:hypothetical protein [Comamonadaceae bacterium]
MLRASWLFASGGLKHRVIRDSGENPIIPRHHKKLSLILVMIAHKGTPLSLPDSQVMCTG